MQNYEKTESLETQSQKTLLDVAKELIFLGFKILPCNGKEPTERVKKGIKKIAKLRDKPLHEGNIEFYLDGADRLSIFTGDKIEVIDIDAKNDLSGRLCQRFLSALKYALPEIYAKLPIITTPSDGLHIYYKAHQIGGKLEHAHRGATGDELGKGRRKMILIESFGEGVHVTTAGDGYNLIQGSLANLPVLTADERATIIAICKSFDQVCEPELKGVSPIQRRAVDSPWAVFNSSHNWEWMLKELCNSGFSYVHEDADRVYILRNGSSAKTSGSIWKESNTLFIFSTSTQFEANKPYSAFGVLCQLSYEGKVHECALDLSEQGIGTWNYDDGEFYSIGKKGKIEVKYVAIKQWLHDIGIRKYYYSRNDFELVQLIGSKADIITIDRIKKIFGDYIATTVPEKILNAFYSSMGKLITKDGIISQLEQIFDEDFFVCSSQVGWLFFRNGALKIEKDQRQFISYDNMEGLVWIKRIIKRDYVTHGDDCDARKFIFLISGEKEDVYHRYRRVIGYLLHLYKDPVDPKVVILNDQFFDEQGISEPQGGTGKGLFIKLLKQFLQTLSLDGKRFDLTRNFAFQGITPDTQLMVIEDAKRNFNFETWFSTITEDLVVEKKGKDEFRIPFERAPKMLITTNYAIKGSSSSHRRRRYELEVAPFFSDRKRPVDHFGRRFFEDWDENEWKAFDNFMVNCLQSFLVDGLPEQVTVNLEKKQAIADTNWDFFNWIEKRYLSDKGIPEEIPKRALLQQFTDLFPDYALGKDKVSDTKFTRWLNAWCAYRDIQLDSSNKDKEKNVMVYRFKGTLKGEKPIVSYEVSSNANFVEGNQTLVSDTSNLVENEDNVAWPAIYSGEGLPF